MKYFEIYNTVNLLLIALITIRIFYDKNEKTIIIIILTSIFSTLCSIQYLLFNSPDVAITEISIGACITTVFILKSSFCLRQKEKKQITGLVDKNKEGNIDKCNRIFKYGIFSLFFALFIIFFEKTSFHFPRITSDSLPFLYNDTIKHYIEQTKDFLQFPNIVTAIIISFRGYDTLIETIVILTAGISVTSILSQNKSIQQITKSILYDKSIISNVVMLILPFIILFAFYIQAHGEESPGGGFQSGSILATAIIGYSITISEDLIRKYLTNSLLMRIGTIGVLLYFTVGLIPIFKGQNFLNHNYVTCGATNLISECHSSSQKISIFISELGVGMTVFAVMTIIFFNLKSEKKYE